MNEKSWKCPVAEISQISGPFKSEGRKDPRAKPLSLRLPSSSKRLGLRLARFISKLGQPEKVKITLNRGEWRTLPYDQALSVSRLA